MTPGSSEPGNPNGGAGSAAWPPHVCEQTSGQSLDFSACHFPHLKAGVLTLPFKVMEEGKNQGDCSWKCSQRAWCSEC